MDNFYIAYRDPLFGIIVFFLLIFIISFANYWWSVYKNKDEEKRLKKFIKKFQIEDADNEYKIIFEDKNLTLDSIILLAKSYEKIGEYEKSIGIYLFALEKYKKRAQKQHLLYLLGKVYLKAGFIERAREIFIESLKISPRHEKSLKYLTITYELLKQYKKAKEALDALEELGVDVKKEKLYVTAKDIDLSNIAPKEKEKLLYELATLKSTQRIYFEFLLKNSLYIDFKKLEMFDFNNLFDLLWYMESSKIDKEFAKKIPLLNDILCAKGIFDIELQNSIFELEVITHLLKAEYQKADIGFEYFCKKCKNSFPFYFSRCPNCHTIDSVEITLKIIKKSYEKNISLL